MNMGRRVKKKIGWRDLVRLEHAPAFWCLCFFVGALGANLPGAVGQVFGWLLTLTLLALVLAVTLVLFGAALR